MTDSVQALRAQLAEAEAQQRAAWQEKANELGKKRTHDWFVDWKSQHVFRCWRHLSMDFRTLALQFYEDHPSGNIPGAWKSELDKKEGMTYVLVGNHLVQTGGGTLILKATPEGHRDSFDPEPRLLTDEEAACLREGFVPDSLKVSW